MKLTLIILLTLAGFVALTGCVTSMNEWADENYHAPAPITDEYGPEEGNHW